MNFKVLFIWTNFSILDAPEFSIKLNEIKQFYLRPVRHRVNFRDIFLEKVNSDFDAGKDSK